jgi:RNA recognition motif-containing protein
MFSRFGTVLDCKVMVDKHTGVSRQIGFVRFDKQEEATRAMTTMNGKKLDPSAPPLVVRYAETEHQRSTRKTRSSSPVPREPFFLPQSVCINRFDCCGLRDIMLLVLPFSFIRLF